MDKGRFLNQKLGKRTDRKSQMLKARLKTQRLPMRSKDQHAAITPKSVSR